jgi:hypothetical protein
MSSEALRPMCHECPFRMAGPPAQGGVSFCQDDVQAWLDPYTPWTCSDTNHLDLCRGADLYHDGKLPSVTQEAMVDFRVINGGVRT